MLAGRKADNLRIPPMTQQQMMILASVLPSSRDRGKGRGVPRGRVGRGVLQGRGDPVEDHPLQAAKDLGAQNWGVQKAVS